MTFKVIQMKGSLLFLISILLAPYQMTGEVYKITIPEVGVKNNRVNIEGHGSISIVIVTN